MPRFSVALDDDENEWVERLADERDRSKSSIVASIVEAAHAEGYDTFVNGESDRTTVNRLDDLEERVAELEARESTRDALAEGRDTADVEESGESGHAVPPRGDGRDQPSDAPNEQPDGKSGDVDTLDDAGEDDVHPEVRDAVERAAEWWGDDDRLADRRAAATAVLEAVRESDHGLTKTEIVDGYYDEYGVDGQSERTWWRRNISEGAEDDAAPAPLRLVADYSRGTHKWMWVGLDETDAE